LNVTGIFRIIPSIFLVALGAGSPQTAKPCGPYFKTIICADVFACPAAWWAGAAPEVDFMIAAELGAQLRRDGIELILRKRFKCGFSVGNE
jgi:hypothetical protein